MAQDHTALLAETLAFNGGLRVLASADLDLRSRNGALGRAAGAECALRIAIGEGNVLLREGIDKVLTEAGHDVVSKSGNTEDFLRAVLTARPDLAILDARLPSRREDDGLCAATEIRQRLPDTGVLILSQRCEPTRALSLIGGRPEGVGYLLKDRVGNVAGFVDAVHRVASRSSVIDIEVVAMMFGRRGTDNVLAGLTARERAVLAKMAEGKSNSGIAESLYISAASVEKHVTAIFQKLDLHSTAKDHRRVQAVLTYLRQDVHP